MSVLYLGVQKSHKLRVCKKLAGVRGIPRLLFLMSWDHPLLRVLGGFPMRSATPEQLPSP